MDNSYELLSQMNAPALPREKWHYPEHWAPPTIVTTQQANHKQLPSVFFPAVPMFFIWISDLHFLWQVGRHYIVDATSEEESQMSSAVSVSVNRNGRVCGLTKRGGVGLDPSVIFDMISVAKHVSQQFIAHLDSKISAAEAAAEWRGEK